MVYSTTGLALILASGSLVSVDRYVYGIVPLAMGLGLLLERHRRWGTTTLVLFALMLVFYSIRMAQNLWVA